MRSASPFGICFPNLTAVSCAESSSSRSGERSALASPSLVRIIVLGVTSALLVSACTEAIVERRIAEGDFAGARQLVERGGLELRGPLPNEQKRALLGRIAIAEAEQDLTAGLAHLSAGDYENARYELASADQHLKDADHQRAIQEGLCRAKYQLHSFEEARAHCERAKQFGASPGELVDAINAELRKKETAAVKAAIASRNATAARAALNSYNQLGGANQTAAAKWNSEIEGLEREAASRAAEQEAAAKRAREAQREARMGELRQKWSAVAILSREQFLNLVMTYTTVLGAPIFSNAEIIENQLQLWATEFDVMQANLRLCADLADAFTVWCDCDAVTTVGVDKSYLGMPRMVPYEFRFNPDAGRSQLRFR